MNAKISSNNIFLDFSSYIFLKNANFFSMSSRNSEGTCLSWPRVSQPIMKSFSNVEKTGSGITGGFCYSSSNAWSAFSTSSSSCFFSSISSGVGSSSGNSNSYSFFLASSASFLASLNFYWYSFSVSSFSLTYYL